MYKSLTTLLAVLALILAGSTYYFYDKLSVVKKNPQVVAQEEAAQLTAVVGRLMVLPEGEIPTIATVTDPELLKSQEFFVNAKKGDKVLIYTNAKKAILYSTATNKIVNVAPVVIGPSEQPGTPPAATVPADGDEVPSEEQ
ncbi:hypothetical protein L0Y69_02600 [bacterium]|nr:hypothetical protein [bacterium]